MNRFKMMVILAGTLVGHSVAQSVKVVEREGHLSPVRVRVTFTNGATRQALLLGIGAQTSYVTHHFGVRTHGGTAQTGLWLDTIAAIRGTDNLRRVGDEFTIELRDGKQLAATFGYTSNCDQQIPGNPISGSVCRFLYLRSYDDSSHQLDLRDVSAVEFLGPARKDRLGNAMFEHWTFSPFTGERLN